MNLTLIFIAIIILLCILCNKISNKIGIPMLLAFILLGMALGSDGIGKIAFDDFVLAEQISSIALIFIIFYGGFGTRWAAARPIAIPAIVLSSLGTVLTAFIVGGFCYLILNIDFLESLLIGAVISSTDAASVFSILRSKRLNLKDNTASLLEVESGSNDPFSYMLTIIILSLMNNSISLANLSLLIISQLLFGIAFGFIIAKLSLFIFEKIKISSSGFKSIFIVAIALLSYSLPSYFGGNGYLSAYICGIILGNHELNNKQELVHFFDGLNGLMQMLLFFTLGLLSFPSQVLDIAFSALLISLFLTFIARPFTVFLILSRFKKKKNQMLLVSWAGMRGAASIVFAIMATIDPAATNHDVFHIVFFIVLFSILIQGTLIPTIASKLHMIDHEMDVMKTFNDYVEETSAQYMQFKVLRDHPWNNNKVQDITLPPNSLLILILRDEEQIIPRGNTRIQENDVLILSGLPIDKIKGIKLYEKRIDKEDPWCYKKIKELSLKQKFIILIKRRKKVIIPNGNTTLKKDDILVIIVHK